MNSPIKYYGSKSNMTDILISYFPNHYKTYVEGFGGGASVLLNKPLSDIEIYNDLSKNVYALFYIISDKEKFRELKERLDLTYYSRDLRNDFKLKLLDTNLSLEDRAFYFFYVNRTSFNGVGGFSASNICRRKMSKSTSDYLSTIDNLVEIHDRLSTTIIENKDILDLLDKYNYEDTFFFLDPPYIQSTRLSSQKYDCEMVDSEHEEMLKKLQHIKSKVLLCGYSNTLYDTYLSDWEKIEFKSPNAKSTAVEVIWRNYNNDSIFE